MKVEDIKTVDDMERFVEGCLNDMDAGIATKAETIRHLADYTVHIVQLVVTKQQNKQRKAKEK